MGRGPGPIAIQFSLGGSNNVLTDEQREAISASAISLVRDAGATGPITTDNFEEGSIIFEVLVADGNDIESILYQLKNHILNKKSVDGFIATLVNGQSVNFGEADYVIAKEDSLVAKTKIDNNNLIDTDWIGDGYTIETLTSVVIIKTITSIGYRAFQYCSNLSSVVIPDGVTSIGYAAFQYCSSLSSVVIPDSVVSIGIAAFFLCIKLKEITIPGEVTNDNFGNSAFKYCTSLSKVTFKQSTLSLVFASTLERQPTVKDEGIYKSPWIDTPFYGSLVEYSFTTYEGQFANVTYADAKPGETTINRSNEVIVRPPDVSAKNTQVEVELTDVDNPIIVNNPVNLSLGAFVYVDDRINQDNLKSWRVTKDVDNYFTTITGGAFRNCSNLSSVLIPEQVISISNSAFRECSSLNKVDIPNNVTYIGNNVFRECTELNEVIIGNKVTIINNDAFSKCSEITKVTFKATDGVVALTFGTETWADVPPMDGITSNDVQAARNGNDAVYP